ALSYLQQFAIDYLKIDRSFVKDLGENPSDGALADAIVVMAHKLGIRVIAEGVETALQRDWLINANCDYVQGYLYAKPLPPEEFEQLVKGGGL
ncbi:MAG TPA: EAL domain-containing protein, partial [Rhodocyclaceae bacterium]|nr:EAL domain-containing protein [Rhodocyclaceae bacterium]